MSPLPKVLLRMPYRWSLDDRDSFDNFFLMHLRTRTVKITNDRGHAGFVAHSSCEMNGLFWIVLGEALDLKTTSVGAQHPAGGHEMWLTFPRCLEARFLGRKAKEP